MARVQFLATKKPKRFDQKPQEGANLNGSVQKNAGRTPVLSAPKMLSYPTEASSLEQGHFVLFQIHKLTSGSLGKEETGDGFKRRSFTLRGSNKTVETQIALYMPAQVGTSYKSNYENKEIGAIAEAGANALADGTASGLVGLGKVAVATGAKQALSKVTGSLIDTFGQGAKELFQLNSGKIVTEKMELMFKGIERRQFQFSFSFIPKSEQESEQVDSIVRAFKVAMLPSYTSSFGGSSLAGSGVGTGEGVAAAALGLNTGEAGLGRTLTIPTTMDIKYYYRKDDTSAAENAYLNKISTCYLTDMDVKYGGERFTAYTPNDKGAPPQNTTLSLTFEEIEMITQEAARVGY